MERNFELKLIEHFGGGGSRGGGGRARSSGGARGSGGGARGSKYNKNYYGWSGYYTGGYPTLDYAYPYYYPYYPYPYYNDNYNYSLT